MNRSEDIKELVLALSKAKAEYPKIGPNIELIIQGKDRSFADLEHMMASVQPILTKYGIDIIHYPRFENGEGILHSIVAHTSGQWIEATLPFRADKRNPQETGTDLTYMERYAAKALLGINPTKDPSDNDGEPVQNEPGISQYEHARLTEELKSRPDLRAAILKKYDISDTPQLYKKEYEEIMTGIMNAKAPK